MAHNPEVEGSSPSPATNQGQRPFLEQRKGLLHVVCKRICARAPADTVFAGTVRPPSSGAASGRLSRVAVGKRTFAAGRSTAAAASWLTCPGQFTTARTTRTT